MKNLIIILLSTAALSFITITCALNSIDKIIKPELNMLRKEMQEVKALNSKLDSTFMHVNKHISSNWRVRKLSKCLGVPYKWGGITKKGFDCSGLMLYALKFNKQLRTAKQQSVLGKKVSRIRKNCLIFFNNYTHVGFAISNTKMIHASSSKGVTIANITSIEKICLVKQL